MIRFKRNPEELARTIYEDYYRKKNNLPKDPVFGSVEERDCAFLATSLDGTKRRIYGLIGREDAFADLNEHGWQAQRWNWVFYPGYGITGMMKTYFNVDFFDDKWWTPNLSSMEKELFILRLTKVFEQELLCF